MDPGETRLGHAQPPAAHPRTPHNTHPQNFDVVNEIFTTLPVVVTLVVMFFHYREVDIASKMAT